MITACHRSQFIPWANINIELLNPLIVICILER
jgi:hypothetical protein